MKKTPMLSFHGKLEIKEEYLTRLRAHYAADEIIQGTGWENGKGCAVGCTLHDYNHNKYESVLGIPIILARIEDRIFEGLPNKMAKEFPIQFLEAIPVGVYLKNVWRHFMIWLLIDPQDGVIRFAKKESTKKAITDVADLLTRSLTEKITADQFEVVRKAAYAAAYDAYDADAYDAAAYAYAAYAAYAAAAYAAAYDAAAYAAYAAAAYAAAYDAAAYDAAAYAAYAAARRGGRHMAYQKQRDKLLSLLKAAK